MSARMLEALWNAFLDTLWMISISAVLVWFFGLALALILIATDKQGVLPMPGFNKVLGSIVNGFRAAPFIILLVALVPLTRFLVGTSIGVWAAIVPITISATPFFARIAEVSLREVSSGVVEAAQAMGLTPKQIMFKVLFPEALPGIISGFTITLVAMINASAMAGTIGAGGLGDLAIRYGFQRYETDVMLAVIAILIALVCLIQYAGDRYALRLRSR